MIRKPLQSRWYELMKCFISYKKFLEWIQQNNFVVYNKTDIQEQIQLLRYVF